jgi:5-methylcytosine-specific restriction enzyme subunit McrC
MLHRVHHFDVEVSAIADLSLHHNSILEYYIHLFLAEVTGLLHRGLIKKYRQQERNAHALKGKMLFAQHLSRNLLHRERFYISAVVYDTHHTLHQILYQALQLIARITASSTLANNAAALLLAFPECAPVRITETLFERLTFDRKTEGYRAAIGIARLLLLRYHPDIVRGRNDVLALLFDMNLLWEQFVYVVLKTKLKTCHVAEQVRKSYWKGEGARAVVLMPDIVIRQNEQSYVVDTKWKVMRSNSKPAVQDLQQMFAYTKYYHSSHTLLLYPGTETKLLQGHFYGEGPGARDNVPTYPCSVGLIGLHGSQTLQEWEQRISESITTFLGL